MDGQLSFETLDYAGKKKRTKRDLFLAEMAAAAAARGKFGSSTTSAIHATSRTTLPPRWLDTAGRAVERKIDLIRKPCKLSPPPRSWRDRRRQALSTNQT